MNTIKVSPGKALELTAILNASLRGVAPDGGFHAIRCKPGVMLIDAVNRDPFVFIAPDTAHKFVSMPGSGTDRLRQRILADQFFNSTNLEK